MEEKHLQTHVNSSGFPLQIKIEHLLKADRYSQWRVLTKEHSWFNNGQGSGGFIDLVLEKRSEDTMLVLECKRVRDTAWIFLVEKNAPKTRRHVKSWVAHYISGNRGLHGWVDGSGDPETAESEFCVVIGQDPKSKPMVERVAAELVDATEAFAEEDFLYHKGQQDFLRIFVPVIVTTAELRVCRFDHSDISIATGEIDKMDFEVVPFVRFRKQLSNRQIPLKLNQRTTYKDIDREKENTVFVVNSQHIMDFLSKVEIHE